MRAWIERDRWRALTVAAIAAVVVAAVASRVPSLGTGEIDWDEGVYWLSMQSMRGGHALFTSVYSSQPPVFLLGTEPVWALLGGGIAAARAVMLAWGALAIVAGSAIGWRLGGRVAAVAAAVTLAVDPIMVRQSVVLQADGPATALGLVAVGFAVLASTGGRRRWATTAAALAGAALAVGVLTKLLDVAVVPPLLAALATRGEWRRLAPAAVAGGLAAGAAVLVPLHGSWTAMWSQAVGLHLDTRATASGLTLAEALQVHWHLLVLAVLGGVAGWRAHRRLVLIGASWIVGAGAAMALTHPLWPHHAVSTSPGCALLCGAGASALLGWLRGVARDSFRAAAATATATALLCVAAGLFLWSGMLYLQPTVDVSGVAGALMARTPAGGQLVGDEQFAQALADRAAPPGFVDTSNTRMYAEPGAIARLEGVADGRPPVCAVLFASGRLAHLPGFATWIAGRYPVVTSLGGSRSLYVLPGCG